MIVYVLALAVVAISGQYTNTCPRTTDYEYCPAFDYDDETVGECPPGWTCEGDAKVYTYSLTPGTFFRIGDDGEQGAATSDYFHVPDSAYDLRWERCGGADDAYGGVIIEDSEGNTICDVRDGTNTDSFFEQTCVIEDYVGQCIRIYTWDSVSGGWGKTFVDDFQFRDASGGDLASCSSIFVPVPSASPTTAQPTAVPTGSPTQVAPYSFDVSAGFYHTCALHEHSLKCWVCTDCLSLCRSLSLSECAKHVHSAFVPVLAVHAHECVPCAMCFVCSAAVVK